MAGTNSTTSISPAEVHSPDLLLVSYFRHWGEKGHENPGSFQISQCCRLVQVVSWLTSILMDKHITSALN